MSSRGTKYWASGSIPLIGPDVLGDIIANLADLAIVISGDGRILSVLANPSQRNYSNLDRWEGSYFRDALTVESKPKFDEMLAAFRSEHGASRPVELNHRDNATAWTLPINYTFHRIGPSDEILLLGRDLAPVAEIQQQLVRAQIALEQDYGSQREYDTRFQVVMRHVSEALVFVTLSDGRVSELNEPAARLAGKPREGVIGKPFAQFFGGMARSGLMDQLVDTAKAGSGASIVLDARSSGDAVRIVPTLFRAVGERLLLCRLETVDDSGTVRDGHLRNLIELFENGVDGVIMTDAATNIVSCNEAFVNLVDATDRQSVRGQPLDKYLPHGAIDRKLLTDNARGSGRIRTHTARLVGEYGSHRPVSISVTQLSDPEAPGYAFVIRESSITESVQPAGAPSPEQTQQIKELVGSAKLKDIVAQTTEVVERMCIEASLELTGNNRVAAADMLRLSRQSLYVKLRKYGMLSQDDSSGL